MILTSIEDYGILQINRLSSTKYNFEINRYFKGKIKL